MDNTAIEATPWVWCTSMYPQTYAKPWATYHDSLWDWVWTVEAGQPSDPYIEVEPRGFGKSTNAETITVAVGATGRRKYCLYISGTQEQADNHVQSIAQRMTQQDRYPDMAERMVSKYGSSMGWRRNRLWTAGGFIVDALGLDSAIRGVKLGDQRPDFIILDDIDAQDDSPNTIDRKIAALTRAILPARGPDCAVLVVQNLIHADGIVTRLVDGRADFLARRQVSGPHPAVVGLTYERTDDNRTIITGGEPTWPEVMSLDVLQTTMDEIGLRAFLAELQHEVELAGTPRFDRDVLDVMRTMTREPLPQAALPPDMRGIPGLRVYALPLPGVAYVAYTDPAEGKGKDYIGSGIGAPRANGKGVDLVLVLEDNDREPSVHADILVNLLERYNRPLWGIERAKGEAIFRVAGSRGYQRLYRHEDNPLTEVAKMAGRQPVLRDGFPMTAATKRGLIDRLGNLIEGYAVGVPDLKVVEQLSNYIVDNSYRTNAAPGGHDDLVIMLAGLCLMAAQPGADRRTVADGGMRAAAQPRRMGGTLAQWRG